MELYVKGHFKSRIVNILKPKRRQPPREIRESAIQLQLCGDKDFRLSRAEFETLVQELIDAGKIRRCGPYLQLVRQPRWRQRFSWGRSHSRQTA